MYKQRLKILLLFFTVVAAVACVRMLYLQVTCCGQSREEIRQMQILPPEPLPTLRGRIVDRAGRAAAKDAPAFYLHVNYQLIRLLDPRFVEGRTRRMIRGDVTESEAQEKFARAHNEAYDQLDLVLEFARSQETNRRPELLEAIESVNNRIWERTRYILWRRSHPRESMDDYRAQRNTLTAEDIASIDLAEMHEFYPLLELEGSSLVNAQIEFAQIKNVEILPETKRLYPCGSAACQIIGWAGPVQDFERERFGQDDFMRYLEGELVGKAGLERVCEPILRGRRGEVQYDKDGNELRRREPQYGQDVRLTLDIELQQRIETFLSDPEQNPKAEAGAAAAVMDAATGDILSLVSTPIFDLNTVRQHYNDLRDDPNYPMIHKALQRNYPPGSTVKPLILIAGLEEKKIGPWDIISCPPHSPEGGWPACLIQWKYHSSHDARWAAEGGNIARNAIRGSCNIYFSRLAARLDDRDLQHWLYRFGYGQELLTIPNKVSDDPDAYDWGNLPQSPGSIIFGIQRTGYNSFEDVPPIPPTQKAEKRYWGIGQGNLRVTALQVANALCTIARDGIYKSPRLVIEEDDLYNERKQHQLPISQRTLDVVREGMFAAVNERGGTGYHTFHDEHGRKDPLLNALKVYGKTGSTQRPEVAWFECFAEDNAGRSVVITIVVPGGQSGAGDAAPLGKGILQICYDMGHIGTAGRPGAEVTSSPDR